VRYLSVCSGIEAATVAWHPLGWTPVGFSEIEAFPSAVLAHHYPDIPNYGDMTQHEQWPITRGAVDLLVGGTPCQSFSVAGLRKGLRDPRGGLMLTYLEIAQRLRPRWVVWENVPGVLSSNGGRDFGSFLGALGELGYGWAYRVLDAQWCRTHRHSRAVPQRRRRVFVVGCLGDGDAAAKVLFERESVRRDTAARRAPRQRAAADAEAGAGERQQVVGALTAKGPDGFGASQVDANHYIPCAVPFCTTSFAKYETGVGTLRREGGDLGGGSETLLCCSAVDQTAYSIREDAKANTFSATQLDTSTAIQSLQPSPQSHHAQVFIAQQHAVAFDWQSGGDSRGLDPKDTAQLQRCQVPAVAFPINGMCVNKELRDKQMTGTGSNGDPMFTVRADGTQHAVATRMSVRRLTPRECERLQGFPDDYTAIPWRGKAQTPDGPRYKALGNSMAVNCMEWIGERIAAQEVAQ
jgi:DNA (cytosine-5)-methyltransferase 1